VLTLAQRFDPKAVRSEDQAAIDSRRPKAVTHVFTSRLAALSNTLTARVHIQRIVIEKVWRFRLRNRRPARAFETSDQTTALADPTAFAIVSASLE
jgi:hypothetical protein